MAEDNIETVCQAAIDADKINGAIFCATDARGHFIYNKTMGERTLLSGEKRPHHLNDVLCLASATKLLATVAALQCVEDGLLSLRGDLSSIAPELSAKQVITGFSEDGQTPLLEPQIRPITLEMLLTHSSGASYHFIDPLVGRWHGKFTPKARTSEESEKKVVEEMFNYPLGFQPGAGWMYGPGLDWAGRIVERVTGKTLGERMHERIFSPLGISDAQFYPVTREDLRERLVDLNRDDPDAMGYAVNNSDINNRGKGDFGGHGLFMTAQDYVKVLRSLLANDGKILSATTVNDMFKQHLSPEATISHHKALSSPLGPFFRVGASPDSEVGYGLGGLLTLDNKSCYGERTLTWGGGLTFAWFIDSTTNLCGVGAFQATVPVNVEALEELKQIFRQDIYRKHAAWKNKEAV